MFLVEYKKGVFIDAERIDWVNLNNGVQFTEFLDGQNAVTVDKDLELSFLNNLQTLNQNMFNIEAVYREEYLNK